MNEQVDRCEYEWPWEHVELVDYCNGCGGQAIHVQRRRTTGEPVFEWCTRCGLEVDYARE